MSGKARVQRDFIACLDRIGLDVVTKNERENSLFANLNTVLSLWCLAFVCEDDERCRLLEWLGVNPKTSDSVLAEILKLAVEHVKNEKVNRLYWQVATTPSVSPELEHCFDVIRQYLGLPILVSTFPSPGKSIINEEVEKVTNGKITKLLEETPVADTTLILANALYFQADWVNDFFNEEYTDWELPESSHEVCLSGGTVNCKCSYTNKYLYFSLPYRGSQKMKMEFFMTHDRHHLPVDITLEEMNELRTGAEPTKAQIAIPTWMAESKINIDEVLEERGIFNQHSVASRSLLVQKATISVDAYGTKACGGSALSLGGMDSLTFPSGVGLMVNRPFIYALRCGSVTEFMGYLYDV